MTDVFLNEQEHAVMRALREGEWLTPSEISERSHVHVQIVRDLLKGLGRRHLAERGGWGESQRWGEWRITDAGLEAVNARDQMRLA